MSDSGDSNVALFGGDDREMTHASQRARANFRYFWRELAWEYRRIVPALDVACVKAAFSDGPDAPSPTDGPGVEHMWVSQIDFDGTYVRGVLMNQPNWIKSVKEGDEVCIPLTDVTDWMYAIDGRVFGAYTVNLMRSRMSGEERRDHDAAWGLQFGDPNRIQVAPERNKGRGILSKWFGKSEQTADDEHPMSQNMAESLREQLRQDPSLVSSKGDRGWTLLHQQALAGSAATVAVLLEAGADRNALTDDGRKPVDLARSLGWERVVELLTD